MKALITLICFSSIMAQTVEWDAEAYAAGNKLQYEAALYFIKESNLNIANKKILDVGCGTSEITGYLAQDALWVHGIDASKNMIDYAQKKQQYEHDNISFEQCPIEDFYTEAKFDVATSFSCFHWFSDQPKALKRMANSLHAQGEIFLDVMTTDIPSLTGFPILEQMLNELDSLTPISEQLAHTFITCQELKDMVINAGFEIIVCEKQICDVIFANESEVKAFISPVLMTRTFMKQLSPEKQLAFLNEYIERLLVIMQRTEDGGFVEPVASTIIHARKKRE